MIKNQKTLLILTSVALAPFLIEVFLEFVDSGLPNRN